MSTQQAVSSSYTAASCNNWEYDVFLSFRGEDTRKNFTGHLYTALNQVGIKVFKDDKELERGKAISPELIKAIEKSRFSIIVFARNYASSTWCLDELVKIAECKNIGGQKVIPIFYDLDPSTVRKQSGSFQEAFIKHEEVMENIEKVQKWKSTLKEVADLSGWDANHRDESELIQVIVKEIICKLRLSQCMNIKDLVGIESRLEKLMMHIGVGSNDVRMIGIWGAGGIGKTTIARVVYELIFDEFEGGSFVANVRENSQKYGIVSLQKQLLTQILKKEYFNMIYDEYGGRRMIRDRLQCKKVLIVLDDVDNELQLNNLANCDWIGSGSRIIITTRNQHLLTSHGVHKIYDAEELDHGDSVRLFSLKAFKSDRPPKDYEELSMQVVKYASGIPLALEVLGSSLFDKSVAEWDDFIKKLHKILNKEIFHILQISFDGLDEFEKEIFLDLACFFKGYDKDFVMEVLNDFSPRSGIRDLVDKSLITISNKNKIEIHDLLQAMGQQIVRESSKEPGRRSRIWEKEDVCHALKNGTVTEGVEGIMSEEDLNIHVSAKAFSKMIHLRLLKVKNVQLVGDLDYLSEKLRLLEWHGYPLNSLPSSLQLDKIVVLNIYNSPIKQLSKGTQPLMLTRLCLEDCPNLNEVPDLIGASNLDELILKRCPRLRRIHPPLLVHEKLRFLEVRDCTNLETLPHKVHMDSLEGFYIKNCPKVKKFPDIVGKMGRLYNLVVEDTAIKDMPSSIELLTRLKYLTLSRNKNLESLPITINGLKSLGSLKLSGCSSLKSLPTTRNGLTSLRRLDLSGCSSPESLPTTRNGLTSLRRLDLSSCSSLESLPTTINGLESLGDLDRSGCSCLESLPTIVNGLKSLGSLDLSGCCSLESLPTTINDLKYLDDLDLSRCPSLECLLTIIKSLESLGDLDLSGCSRLESLPTTINGLKSLERLDLSDCSKLDNVAETLVQAESLKRLNLSGTAITQQTSSIFLMKNLVEVSFKGSKGRLSGVIALMLHSLPDPCYLKCLDLSDCGLREEAIPDEFFSRLVSLIDLDLSRNDFVSLPDSTNSLPKLQRLFLEDCKRLQSVPELPSSVRWIDVNGCASLETLSDAFKANNSDDLYISCVKCWKLFNGGSLMFTMLKDFLKAPITRRWFSMVGPGSEIPEWIRCQSVGSGLRIKRPQDLYDDKLAGFVLCCVFVVYKHLPLHDWIEFVVQVDHVIQKSWMINAFNEKSGHSISENLWLLYVSLEECKEQFNEIEFSTLWRDPGVKVKRCGFHPIYEKDLPDLNGIIKQSSSSTSSQDFIGSIMGVVTTRRNLPKYDDEEAEPKGLKMLLL